MSSSLIRTQTLALSLLGQVHKRIHFLLLDRFPPFWSGRLKGTWIESNHQCLSSQDRYFGLQSLFFVIHTFHYMYHRRALTLQPIQFRFVALVLPLLCTIHHGDYWSTTDSWYALYCTTSTIANYSREPEAACFPQAPRLPSCVGLLNVAIQYYGVQVVSYLQSLLVKKLHLHEVVQ